MGVKGSSQTVCHYNPLIFSETSKTYRLMVLPFQYIILIQHFVYTNNLFQYKYYCRHSKKDVADLLSKQTVVRTNANCPEIQCFSDIPLYAFRIIWIAVDILSNVHWLFCILWSWYMTSYTQPIHSIKIQFCNPQLP